MEIRIHGRGGQGVVSASKMIAEAAYLEGYYSQSMPFFGAERRGAHVVSSARLSDKPILRISQVYSPDVVVVLDPLLLNIPEVFSGLKSGGFAVLNSKSPVSVAENIVYVDATEISLRHDLVASGVPIPNVPMLGALLKTNIPVSYETMEEVVETHFGREAVDSFEEGYKRSRRSRLTRQKRGGKVGLERLPESKCEVPISFPSKGVAGNTGMWRFAKPVVDVEKCNKCMSCWLHCPEGVIMESDEAIIVNYAYCKGCMICKEVCPKNAIRAVKEVICHV